MAESANIPSAAREPELLEIICTHTHTHADTRTHITLFLLSKKISNPNVSFITNYATTLLLVLKKLKAKNVQERLNLVNSSEQRICHRGISSH